MTPTPSNPSRLAEAPALKPLDGAALDALFATLPAPAENELAGDYPGRVLTGAGFEALPGWLAPPLRALAAALWRAKAFAADGRGINLWWSPAGLRRHTPYRTGLAPAALGEGEVLVLDYDLAANPALARRVRGELRRLAPGLYLGRMLLRSRTPARPPRLVSYFSLQKPRP